MRMLRIGRTVLPVKDYECSDDGIYDPKEQLRLWLYVNLTDACPAGCPFCVHASARPNAASSFDTEQFRKTLAAISPFVSGVSITGGEPMLDVHLLEETVAIIRDQLPLEIELDMVTNGYNLSRLPSIRGLERFAAIHISRHAVDDEVNRKLMKWPQAPSLAELKAAISELKDPGAIVLNCVLQRDGVCDTQSAVDYLETAASVGAANVSFIGMFLANDYCRDAYVSPKVLEFQKDSRFDIWNRFADYDYCSCSSGSFKAEAGRIRFYYRCPGNTPAPAYCRQLVYGADGILRQGFGNAERILL